MFNIKVTEEGSVCMEYPSIPNKDKDSDIVIIGVENDLLLKDLLNSNKTVKITNIETLEYETTLKEIPSKEPTEIQIIQEKLTQLEQENTELRNIVNVYLGGV